MGRDTLFIERAFADLEEYLESGLLSAVVEAQVCRGRQPWQKVTHRNGESGHVAKGVGFQIRTVDFNTQAWLPLSAEHLLTSHKGY